MIKYFFLLALTFISAYATEVLTPTWQLDVNASVKDMVVYKNTLVVGTDNGTLKVYKNNQLA